MVLEQQEEYGRALISDEQSATLESLRRGIANERNLHAREIGRLCDRLEAQRAELTAALERGDRFEREAYEATQCAIAAGSDHETIARLTQERDGAIKALADALEELEALRGKAETLERTVRIGRHDHDEDLERCYRLERIADALAVALVSAQR